MEIIVHNGSRRRSTANGARAKTQPVRSNQACLFVLNLTLSYRKAERLRDRSVNSRDTRRSRVPADCGVVQQGLTRIRVIRWPFGRISGNPRRLRSSAQRGKSAASPLARAALSDRGSVRANARRTAEEGPNCVGIQRTSASPR